MRKLKYLNSNFFRLFLILTVRRNIYINQKGISVRGYYANTISKEIDNPYPKRFFDEFHRHLHEKRE